jgi:transposase
MGHGETEILSAFFSFPDGIVVQALRMTTEYITIQIACDLSHASCPLCGHVSERIHECYTRTVVDLPCGERSVVLSLRMRKFLCHTPTCPRKIFTERLPALVLSYARKTNRLRERLEAVGFATCGEAGTRLTEKLGMEVSASTFLRAMRAAACPPPDTVRILGVDDWGATRSCICSCKDSRKEDLTGGSAPSALPG